MWAKANRRILVALAVLLLAGPTPVFAQEDKKAETYKSAAVRAAVAAFNIGDPRWAIGQHLLAGEHPQLEDWKLPMREDFWITDRGLEFQAALSMIGARDPVGAATARVVIAGFADFGILAGWRFVYDEPMPLSRRYLNAIRDNRPLPDLRLKTGNLKPILPEFERIGSPDWGWHQAYLEAIRHSHAATLEMFKKAAGPNQDVLFHSLKSNPAQHRGKIISVTGKLVVLRKEEAPRFAPEGLEHLYIGYIIGPTKGVPPFAVALTQMPEGVEKPSENLNVQVTVHGYFLSMVRFPADKKAGKMEDDVISPYLVGKTAVVNSAPKKAVATDEFGVTYYIVMASLIGIFSIGVLVALLNVWVRRRDRKIETQLRAMRDKQHPFNLEPAEPSDHENPAAPPAPPTQTGFKLADSNGDAPKPPENLG